MTEEALKILFGIPLFVLGCFIFYYSPARLIKRLFGKAATGEEDKTFIDHMISTFLDLTSIMLAIILLAVGFQKVYQFFNGSPQ